MPEVRKATCEECTNKLGKITKCEYKFIYAPVEPDPDFRKKVQEGKAKGIKVKKGKLVTHADGRKETQFIQI